MWLKESESGWKGKTIPVWVLLFAASFVPGMRADYEMIEYFKKNAARNKKRHAL